MTEQSYRAAIIGLGYIGGADQVSGDALRVSSSKTWMAPTWQRSPNIHALHWWLAAVVTKGVDIALPVAPPSRLCRLA